MFKKFVTASLLVLLVAVTAVTVWGTDARNEDSANRPTALTLEEQSNIIWEYGGSPSCGGFIDLVMIKTPGIPLVGIPDVEADRESIVVGISDVNDEKRKEAILSLPGIDRDAIIFVYNEAHFIMPATEPPANRQETPNSRGITCQMGSIIKIGSEYGTIGSPTDSTHFYTYNHGSVSVGQLVTDASTGIGLGSVSDTFYDTCYDASRVQLNGSAISSPLYSYRGSVPANGTTVKAYTGYSGTISGTISNNSAARIMTNQLTGTSLQMTDLIAVYMKTQGGDSGSCLVKTGPNGEEAIGILAGGGPDTSGTYIAYFTKIANLPY